MEKEIYLYIWEWDLSICVTQTCFDNAQHELGGSATVEEEPAVYIMVEQQDTFKEVHIN